MPSQSLIESLARLIAAKTRNEGDLQELRVMNERMMANAHALDAAQKEFDSILAATCAPATTT